MHVTFTMKMGLAGCEVWATFTLADLGMDEKDWEELTQGEREQFLDEELDEWTWMNLNRNWTIEEDS